MLQQNNFDGDNRRNENVTTKHEEEQMIGRYYLRSRRPFGENIDNRRYNTHNYQPYSMKQNSYRHARGDEQQDLENQNQSIQQKSINQPKMNTDFNKIMPLLLKMKGIDISNSSKIGEGRYSKVITGNLIKRNLTIAIKIINRGNVAEEFKNKFLPRELEIWQKIRHSNLVGLLAIYEYEQFVLLVNEYGKMGNLLNYVIENGPTREAQGLLWATQMLSAVGYLHQKKIAHRDLKLENIIIFNEKTVKIADFGFSRSMENIDLSTTYCGSKAYSAPEVLSGMPYNPFKSDIWSLGVVFYVMLTNRMPFHEKMSNQRFIQCQKNRNYSWRTELNLTEESKMAVNCLMTFNPLRRPDINSCFRLPWIQRNLVTLNNNNNNN